jgi:hypothetical protein
VLIKQVAALDHLEGRERLLSLVVIIQLPRKIANSEEDESEPKQAPAS